MNKTHSKTLPILILAIISLDQITKYVVMEADYLIKEPLHYDIIPNWLAIVSVKNYGIAFGIPIGGLIFNLVLLGLLVFLTMAIFLPCHSEGSKATKNLQLFKVKLLRLSQKLPFGAQADIKKYSLAISIIIAGGLGNLIDRFRLGYVIDFISFSFWPAFNIADMAITLGAILLVYRSFKKKSKIKD